MSNYHVRSVSKNGRNASVIFHIPIPVENNGANVALKTALSEHIKSQDTDGSWLAFQSQIQGIDAGELTSLRNGELYEHSETVKFLSADTNGQKQTKIDDRYIALTTSVVDNVRAILKFWGLNRNI